MKNPNKGPRFLNQVPTLNTTGMLKPQSGAPSSWAFEVSYSARTRGFSVSGGFIH